MPLATTTIFRRKNVFAALAGAAVLLLSTGCAQDMDLALGGDSGSNATDSSNGSDTSTSAATGVECLPGDWLFDNDGFEKFLGSLSGTFDIAVSGKATLTLRADGTNQTDYDKWTHDVSVKDGKSIVVRHGVDKGTYTASADGAMSMTDTSVGSITSMTIHASGQVINKSVKPEPSIFSQARYSCSGDKLEIEVDGYTALMLRQR